MTITPIQSGESVLRPRARLIKTIGEDLISSDIVALLELVKNSYDADATIIAIEFSGEVYIPPKGDKKEKKKLQKTGSTIEIFDDGTGMTLETVKEAWMEPATISKKMGRLSSGKKRKLTGEKGIGRFSSAKLSGNLEMVTRCKDDNEVFAHFKWDDFDHPDLFLDEVVVDWHVRKPIDFRGDKHGTRLTMTGLNADWDEDKFRQLRVTLQRLINPVVPVENFLIELRLPEEFSSYSALIEPPETLTKPNYSIKGAVNGDGTLIYEYSSKRRGKSPEKEIKLIKPDEKILTGPFSFDFRVWDRDTDALKEAANENNAKTAELRRALNEISGVSIYRDGFRVLPYGDPKLDWLRLDLRRVNNPTLRISNNQIIGFISIDLENNPKFTDQSNREGIVDSDELEQLKEFVRRILAELEAKRYEERPREQDSHTGGGLFESFSIRPLIEFIKARLPNDQEAKSLIDETQASIEAGVIKVQDVLSRYRRLSTLGLLVDSVLHDGNNFVGLIDGELQLLVKSIKADGFSPPVFYSHVEKIAESRNALALLFKRLEPFGGRKKNKPSSISVDNALSNVFGLFQAELDRLNIKVNLPDQSDTNIFVVESDLQLIFVNLIQNSIYWLGEKTGDRQISVSVKATPSSRSIIFSDNGPGVEEEFQDFIFDPYFSRKTDGIGLGLTIVGELVTENNGTLELIDDGPLDGASFRMVFSNI